jgi:hypothetical protein
VVTIFGTTYYTIGAGLLMLALLAPLFYLFARWLLRPNVEDEPRRKRLLAEGGLTLGLLLIAAVALHWDVYLIGQRAKVLCEQTGLVVHTTAPAGGFVGSTAIRYWSRYGFEWLEDTIAGKKYRIVLEDGKELRREIPDFAGQFELRHLMSPSERDYVGQRIVRLQNVLIDRRSGEPVAILTKFSLDRGWIDSIFIDLSGLTASPKVCGRDAANYVVIGNGQLGITELVTRSLLTR